MNHPITRRSLFRLGVGSLGLLGVGGRLARFGLLNAQVADPAPEYKAVVCVFLMGGNDSNNLLVPIQTAKQGYSAYQGIRGSALSLAQSSLLPITTSGGELYGFHPELAALQSLYQRNRLAVVANVGTLLQPLTKAQYAAGQQVAPRNLFSHADQQHQWQTTPGGSTGWGGRAADLLQALNFGSAFPTGVSLAGNSAFLTGQASAQATLTTGGLALAGSDGSAAANARNNAFQQILAFNSGLSLVQTLNQYTASGLEAGSLLTSALATGSGLQTVFPTTGLGQQLRQVAQILKVRGALGMRRQIFFVSQGGYDTHTNQMVQQNGLFRELAGALAAFDSATQELGLDGQVVTFTESEFGRTLQPSTSAGSDHAWGGHQLVMGSALPAADVYGEFPQLALGGPDDVSQRGVWLPSASLDQYAATVASWLGVADDALPSVFPNLAQFANPKLGFL
jgi:uncharacterized protein (DUF1501 family)